MHIGKSYRLADFLLWTRRKAYVLLALSVIPVAAHQLAGWHWLAVPWVVVALLGTATSFIVGFKNAQTYGRTLEAQQVWTAIAAISRYWAMLCRNFPVSADAGAMLVQRHLAWLTAVRYQARGRRVWETASSGSNHEYRDKRFIVPEHETPLSQELARYLSGEELARVSRARGKATLLMHLQSDALRAMAGRQELAGPHHIEMQKTLKDLLDQQARVERIKNFPYPRQYAIVNTLFVWSFAALLPFGLAPEFHRLAGTTQGLLAIGLPWLAAPFSLLISWMYVSLDQVGESTENPFEGGANDVPITQVCRLLEIEMRQVDDDSGDLHLPLPSGDIIL
ncbi:MAG: bestrophin family ion channel [Pseudomonadota bacterium]